jgi:hypothetical protein
MQESRKPTDDLGLRALRDCFDKHKLTVPFDLIEACYRAEYRCQYDFDESAVLSEVRGIVLHYVEERIAEMPKEIKSEV